jgi:hypothetical protein
MTAIDQPAARAGRRRLLLAVLVALLLALLLAPELILLLARCWLPRSFDGPDAGLSILSTSPWGSDGHQLSIGITPGRACTLLAAAIGHRVPLLPLYPGMSVAGELRIRGDPPAEPPAGASGAASAELVRLGVQLRVLLHGAHPQLSIRISPAVADALLASSLRLRIGLMSIAIHPQAADIVPIQPPTGDSCAVHVMLRGNLDLDFGSASEQVVVDRLAGTLSARFVSCPGGLQPVLQAHLESIQVEGPEAATLDSDTSRQQLEEVLNASLASSLADKRLPAWIPTDCQLTGSIAPPDAR